MARFTWIVAGCALLIALVLFAVRRDGAPRSRPTPVESSRAPTPLEILTGSEPLEAEAGPAPAPETQGRFALEEGGAQVEALGEAIVVRVVTAERVPVEGMRVVLGFGLDPGHLARWRTTVTNGDGLAILKGARKQLTEGLVAIFVKPPFLRRLRKDFAVDLLPRRPIGFRLPPTGAIAVHVRDARGRNVSAAISVRLGMIAAGELEAPARAFERRTETRSPCAGIALFEALPLGQRFEVTAFHPASFAEVEAACPGPTSAGECVSVELAFGEEHPILGLRAVDEAGAPLANTSLTVETAGAGRASRRALTDERGSLLLFLGAGALGGAELRLTTGDEDGPRTASCAFGPLAAGRNEGGDLVFRPATLLASGRVVDAAGQPVPDCSVTWEAPGGGGKGTTDAEGRFAVRSDADPGPWFVQAAGNRGRSVEVEVSPGGTDLELVLRGTGNLRGRLECGGGAAVRGIDLELRREDGQGRALRQSSKKHSFGFSTLPAGSYQLRVLASDEVLAEVRALVISPGGTLLDPRLDPLDLRGRMTLHRIEYEYDGRNESGTLRYGPAGSPPETWDTADLRRSETWVASTSSSIDVELLPNYHLSQRLENVQGHARTTLLPLLDVRLRVHSAAPLPVAPLLLEARLEQAGRSVSLGRESMITAGSPEARLRVNKTGPCEVRWTLHSVFSGANRSVPVDLGPPPVLDVRATSEEQVFHVDLPGEALARLLQDPPF